MRIVKLMILMLLVVTVCQAYLCYVNFTPARVIWLIVSSHTLMFYVMFFTVDFIIGKRR